MIQTSSRNLSQQVFTKTTGNRILLPIFDAIAVDRTRMPPSPNELAKLVFAAHSVQHEATSSVNS
ncbi:hypothetical protein CEE69_13670 [Rhodopirellula bahusiensis]|uniref:Uncharacterized protein n=1 Tax=Rhodopirellula bahusiensis TaxID=2014065 RepID=A0A2G1W7B3_9BACT|nr:hypothetical protein CEE69_13670 [Rhodopirellula bahusiensis]